MFLDDDQLSDATADIATKLQAFQALCVDRATGTMVDEHRFLRLRRALLRDPTVAPLLPDFVKKSRSVGEFWGIIQPMFGTYQERRLYLYDQFRAALDVAESEAQGLVHQSAKETLTKLDTAEVAEIWTRAMKRRVEDPEGAITLARTLLETVCKLVLDDLQVTYADDVELPKLYGTVANALTLGPSQHTEEPFKRILGGCTSVVEGLGTLRNKLGDAHGKGRKQSRAKPRHAELAVNLAGTMATFIVATWQARRQAQTAGT